MKLEKILDQHLPQWRGKTTTKFRAGVILDVKFPQEKFDVLYNNDFKFKRTWDRERPEFADDDSRFDYALAVITFRVEWTEEEVLALLKKNRERFDSKGKLNRPDYFQRTIHEAKEDAKNSKEEFPLTDAGNAERFVSQHHENVRYCQKWKSWLLWDSKQWAVDETGAIISLAIQTARSIHNEAANCTNSDKQKLISRHALQSQHRNRLEAMLALARHMVPIRPDQLDENIWLLNCQNGTLNLKTGKLQAHKREDLISKIVPVAYDPEARCPLWEKFVDEIMESNSDLVAYLQRLSGYLLTGDTSEQSLWIFHGTGLNGKTTLIETLMRLLSEYGRKTPTATFLKKKNDTINNDLAALAGARFACAVESSKGKALDEVLIKQVTGQDSITARFLFKEFFTYKPQFKVILATNEPPEIEDGGFAFWRRVKMIPFKYTVPAEAVDKRLQEKLEKELPGILRWAVEGCLAWQTQGLGEPDMVTERTKSYRLENEPVEQFIEERCILSTQIPQGGTDLWVVALSIRTEFNSWCDQNGVDTLSIKAFGQRIKKIGVVSDTKWLNGKTTCIYKGIGLKSHHENQHKPYPLPILPENPVTSTSSHLV